MEIVVPEAFQHLYVRDSKRPVFKVPDPVLRGSAAAVEKFTKKTGFLIDDMMRAMREANGIGLAAPQLGILQRIIVIAPDGFRPTALINPRIIKSEGSFTGEEGCLSIPGLYGDVTRPAMVEVEAFDRKGRRFVFDLEGMPAKVVQHEIDHLDGILFIDKVDQSTLHWHDPNHDAE
jgi:peptide deformylase